MIKADLAQNPTKHVLSRAQTMRVERVGPQQFRVTPAEEGKLIRIVRFHEDEEDGLLIECYSETTHADCGANTHNRYCAHCEAVVMFLLEPKEK